MERIERIFYKPVMSTSNGNQFQIYIPKSVGAALELKDRDEVKILIEKTGRSIPKQENRFKRKKVNPEGKIPAHERNI